MSPDDQDALEAQALTVGCLRCGRPRGVPCWSYRTREQVPAHPSRLARAEAVGSPR